MLRIAILWSELPPYILACVRALAKRDGVELLVVRYSHAGEKPFDENARELAIPVHTVYEQHSLKRQWHELRTLLKDYKAHVAVVSGWAIPVFNQAVRFIRKSGGKVICTSDNPWRGDFKHIVGSVFARQLFRRRYSAMFVPGERALPLASALGFNGWRLIKGGYSCDWPLYSQAFIHRYERSSSCWPRVFIFLGSLIERKGLTDIIDAYRGYRQDVSEPWELWVVGDGPLLSSVDNEKGVISLGFKQPVECADLMSKAGAFVLASYSEPWGVVIHEAAAAGLPILCTDICGAAADLVSDGHNGYLFEPGDVDHLRELMVRITSMRDEELQSMGRNSFNLSKKITPELWADRLLRAIGKLGLYSYDKYCEKNGKL